MDAWSNIVLVVNVLLLIAGWLLFQQAKSDLTARAAETPVLTEVKELQRSIAILLEQLRLESGQMSTQMEARCIEARDLLAALDRRLEEGAQQKPLARPSRRAKPANGRWAHDLTGTSDADALANVPEAPGRRESIYALADAGLDAPDIGRKIGCSTGEVELILGLRSSTS